MELEIIDLKNRMTPDQIKSANELYNGRKKDLLKTFLIFIVSWFVGGHRFYLKKYVSGTLMLLTSITLIISAVFNIDVIMFMSVVVILVWALIDLILLNSMVKKYNKELEYDILKEVIDFYTGNRKNATNKNVKNKVNETVEESIGIIGELSLNNNRLFSIKGSIKNKEVKECIDALYDTLKSAIKLVKSGEIESYELEKITTFYLPELIEILNKFIDIESSSIATITVKENVIKIKEIIINIQNNLDSIVKETNKKRHDDIALDLEVLKKSMAIEGFDDKYN